MQGDMVDLLSLTPALLLGLAVAGAAVFGGRDTTIFVPPPESLTEQFVRQVATRRCGRAMEYVEPSSGVSLTTVR